MSDGYLLAPLVGDQLGLPSEDLRRPEQRGDLLDYYLGPTGLPERLGAANELLNPYAEPMEYYGYAAGEGLSPEERAEYAAYATSQALLAGLPGAALAKRAAKGVRGDLLDKLFGRQYLPPEGRAVIRRDSVYRGEGPSKISPTVAASDAPYAVRLTGKDQLEDMIASGLVRPKPGGYGKRNLSQIYFGESSSPDPSTSLFSRPSAEKPVALVGRPGELGAYEGGVPIDALERVLMRQDDGELVDILDDIIARNRAR